ncbi:unnamed protein product [Rangifer tarandus platyrhynchus]|uniref:Uncharacterized protein n=2 Tax=Rangifer tarandus platyrhynchus TaxID=3082113 RepID=A0ABN8Z5R1_RANTA|nr:unnamed protein product [Rangifer tarandus platyrhynchus]CAI9703974.1 unnamed protein product [Rangifer tarandus platyrhynchus]
MWPREWHEELNRQVPQTHSCGLLAVFSDLVTTSGRQGQLSLELGTGPRGASATMSAEPSVSGARTPGDSQRTQAFYSEMAEGRKEEQQAASADAWRSLREQRSRGGDCRQEA